MEDIGICLTKPFKRQLLMNRFETEISIIRISNKPNLQQNEFNMKIQNTSIKLDDKIHVSAVEAIAGSTFLLTHEYNPYNLCLNFPNFRSFRLHSIERAITFNVFRELESQSESDDAKQRVISQLSDEDIIHINEVFNSAVDNDYADYIEGLDYFNFKLQYSDREIVIEKLEALKIKNPTLRDCFDLDSFEYTQTTKKEKIKTLKKIVNEGLSLLKLSESYVDFYDSINKPYVSTNLDSGLKALINYLLSELTSYKIRSSDEFSRIELCRILTLLLKDKAHYARTIKGIFYAKLVEKRRIHDFNDDDLFNPSQLNITKDEHLNAWAYWHGDLNADILLIGQDFGGKKYYEDHNGDDSKFSSPTNDMLNSLFKEISNDINLLDKQNSNAKLYFTNAVLGAKNGDMVKAIKKSWYLPTANLFIKPLIEIIQPPIIIAMGRNAYETIASIYNLKESTLTDIVESNPIQIKLPNAEIKLFTVYHCSKNGRMTRKHEQQKEDWRKIKPFYEQIISRK